MADLGDIAIKYNPLFSINLTNGTSKLTGSLHVKYENKFLSSSFSGELHGKEKYRFFSDFVEPNFPKQLIIEHPINTVLNGEKDDLIGNPSPPSLYLPTKSSFKFKWVVESGSRTIQISVRQPLNLNPRPTLLIKENLELNISNTSGSAPNSTGWTLIGPISVSPIANGVLTVEISNNLVGVNTPCWFDNIVVE
jgi:hypothetical protein